jgi:competence protein ComEC
LNVGWLVLCVWLIAFPLDWHYRTTAAVALVVLLAYAVIAEPNPPILRAVLMGVIGCIGLILRQRFNALNWLAAAAIILLLFNPGILFAASFQLSFVVVLGLILLAPLVPDPIHAVDRWRRGLSKPPADLASVDEDSMHLRSAFLEFLLDAVRITSICALTAWLVGLPLSVYHFGMFAPWGFVNSILLAPFAFVVMVLGFLKLILAPIAYVSVDLLGPALHGVTKAMNGVVLKMAAIPGTSLSIEPPSPVWVACCYVLMLLWLWRARGPALGWPSLRLPRGALPLAAALLAVWPFLPLKAWLRPRDRVTVWTLAVGNGTATVIELPDGRTLLYDCGSRSSFDAAARSVVPFLRWRGIRSIDAAFVSHPDLDHYSGIEGVSKAVAIRRLVLNEHFEEFGADQPAVTEFLRRVRELGIPVERIRAGWALADSRGAAVECLWPPPAGAFITNDNSTSTVLRIAFADRALLLTGDIDNYALDQLLARGGLACDAMHLPHHGSVTALTGRFLDAARPSVAIRSSGQHDRDTRNGLLSLVRNMTYFNTADDGCIRMTLGRDGVEATPHRGRPD